MTNRIPTPAKPLQNPRNVLNEFCQKYRLQPPCVITTNAVDGFFTSNISVEFRQRHYEAIGKGQMKSESIRHASEELLNLIKIELDDTHTNGKDRAASTPIPNPICLLNEFCQKNKLQPPKYTVSEPLKNGSKQFHTVCSTKMRMDFYEKSATAPTKKESEREAASKLLSSLLEASK